MLANSMQIGDILIYDDKITKEEMEGIIVFIEELAMDATLYYVKSPNDDLNDKSDPRFSESYCEILPLFTFEIKEMSREEYDN